MRPPTRTLLAAVTSLALAVSSTAVAAPELTEEQQQAQDKLDELTDDTPAPETEEDAAPSMTADQARILDDAARKAFDEGDYGQAAANWDRAVRETGETSQTHLERYSYTLNAVTSYRQVFEANNDTSSLTAARELIRVYLQQCQDAYEGRCDGLDETRQAKQEARDLDRMVLEHQVPEVQPSPSEEGLALGGRPYDRASETVPVPEWAYAALILGAGVAAGGTAMIIRGTDDKFAADASAYDFDYRGGGIGDTDGSDPGSGDTDGSGGDTSGGSTGSGNIQISDETKGKLLIGFGSLVAAIGVGLIVHGAIVIGKNRRLNRRRRDRVALQPVLGPRSAGLGLSGRF